MQGTVIELSADDDVAGVSERIEWANAQRIALVMPARNAWRELDYERLKRLGKQHGCEIAVISKQLEDRLAAREIGLAAFNTVEQAQRQRWLLNPDVEAVRRLQAPRRFKPDSLRRFFRKRTPLRHLFGLLVSLTAIAALVGGAVMIAPTARVTLTASSQPVEMIVPLSIDPQRSTVDLANRVIPAQRIDVVVEDRIGVETTGKRSIDRFRAQGQVTFINRLTTPYRVPANTVVRTSGSSTPARFVTLNDVEVPGSGRAGVGVEAVDEGVIGNVGPQTINQVEGVPSLAVGVINGGGTGGGGAERVRAVAQADIDRAKRQLREKLFAEAVKKMNEAPDVQSGGLYVVPETLFIADVQDETADRFVTEQADVVNVSTRMQVAALAVSPGDLSAVARGALLDRTPKGFSLLSSRALRGDAAEEDSGGGVRYFIVAKGIAGAEIDPNDVRRAIAGKTRAEAQQILLRDFELNGPPRIVIEPAWWTRYVDRVPWITLRIDAQVRRE
jgi:hypothetical protein